MSALFLLQPPSTHFHFWQQKSPFNYCYTCWLVISGVGYTNSPHFLRSLLYLLVSFSVLLLAYQLVGKIILGLVKFYPGSKMLSGLCENIVLQHTKKKKQKNRCLRICVRIFPLLLQKFRTEAYRSSSSIFEHKLQKL